MEACADDGAALLPDVAFGGTDADLKPGDAVGEYRVEAKLGVGGFGTVYRAEHPVIGKKVAIKVLAREFSAKPEVSARFIDEARAANQIRHKGIIDIFAFGTLGDGRHYFVMELLEGSSLEDHLRANGPMAPQDALTILRGVARAVDAAHVSGIAHRDLKPDNVFLVRGDDGVHTKLLDFGVAKLLGNRSGQKTQTGTPIGTPHYMSPEQARGVNVGILTDVYSFGVMTYQMLTGVLPFEGDVVMDILVKHMSEAPTKPSAKNPSLPTALDAPIMHMLAKDADARPHSLGAAVDELSAAWVSAGGVPEAPTSSLHVSSVPSARVVSQRTFVGATTEIAPAPKKRGAAVYAAVAIAVIAIGGVAVFFTMKDRSGGTAAVVSDRPTATAPAVSAAASTTTAPVMSVAQAAADVMLTIDSTPAHVEVWDGTTKLGMAPGPIRVPRASGTRKLTFKLPGYAPRDSDVDVGMSGTLSIALTPQAGKPAPTTKPTSSSQKTPSELETPTF